MKNDIIHRLGYEWISKQLSGWEIHRYDEPFCINKDHDCFCASFSFKDMSAIRAEKIQKAFDDYIIPGGNLGEPEFYCTPKGWVCFENYYPSLLEGYSIKAFPFLSDLQKTRIMLCAVCALQTLHRSQLVHGSLHSNNFRICKAEDNNFRTILAGYAYTGTVNECIAGYPEGYRSPEIQFGRYSTQKTDIYALGVCFYLWLTGYMPSRDHKGKLLIPSDVPEKYHVLLSEMLQSREEKRAELDCVVDMLKGNTHKMSSDFTICYENDKHLETAKELYNDMVEANTWMKY